MNDSDNRQEENIHIWILCLNEDEIGFQAFQPFPRISVECMLRGIYFTLDAVKELERSKILVAGLFGCCINWRLSKFPYSHHVPSLGVHAITFHVSICTRCLSA